ncbi:transmembrane protein 174 isoform X1 [Pithys albifrons albifrons]|uniref:transmembrane protein 174 isoform X1 n=1 Tax=Pithys albifrons albifrons TaxID=3385563 RepID=UPI003A5CD247
MEQNNNNVEDFSLNVFSVTPCRPNRSDAQVSDGDKAGTTLLFSVVQYIPPPYPSQEGIAMSPSYLHPVLSCCSAVSSSASPVPTPGSPHFCPAYPLDNLAFTGDENFTTYPAENTRNHRSEDSSDETEELGEDYTCNNLSPPRYEEIYPLSS